MIAIVDTNVPVTANGHSEQASPDCVTECVRWIRKVTKKGRLVIDDDWRIIKEYQANLSPKGQPGVGDAFLRWVLTNWKNPTRCDIVTITPIGADKVHFLEFPVDRRLASFDKSDRKFVAVAKAHHRSPPILQAVDSKWWGFKVVLMDNKVNVKFLCPKDVEKLCEKKMKQSRKKKAGN